MLTVDIATRARMTDSEDSAASISPWTRASSRSISRSCARIPGRLAISCSSRPRRSRPARSRASVSTIERVRSSVSMLELLTSPRACST
jgi:hypothetical protein